VGTKRTGHDAEETAFRLFQDQSQVLFRSAFGESDHCVTHNGNAELIRQAARDLFPVDEAKRHFLRIWRRMKSNNSAPGIPVLYYRLAAL
jgi:hypothetical protein